MKLNSVATISIMADFGNGPYAWLRKPDENLPYVGGNIADAVSGFPEHFGVTQGLQKQLADWVIDFENNYDKESFNWKKWNQCGINLSKKLKLEVGNHYLVEYHFPCEDPNYNGCDAPVVRIRVCQKGRLRLTKAPRGKLARKRKRRSDEELEKVLQQIIDK